jgi:tRNA pseudouridine38-40 synthase
MVFKLTIQYDGTNYVGWQRQASGVSIQGLLEDALAPIAKRQVDVVGAGRTDAGVHALGQVVSASFETRLDEPTLRRALNAALPPDVRVSDVATAAPGFHARFAARSKRYEYRIARGPFVSPFDRLYAWHVPYNLDVGAMRAAAGKLTGRHDFAAFQAAGSEVRTTERHLFALDVREEGPRLTVEAAADGFLRHMVRTIVGTLVETGSGRISPSRVAEVLASRDRSLAGPTAPALGLFLVSVEY